MTKKAKNIILAISFLSFFILSYLVVLYAFGYQFDFRNLKWVETGSLIIRANNEVEIFIDDRLEGKTSFISNTFVEKNLLPGRYNLRIEKEDFVFNKNVEIKSGEITQLLHLYLTAEDEIENFIISQNQIEKKKSSYFIDEKDRLLYKDLGNSQSELIFPEQIDDFIVSPDNKKIALITSNEISVFWLEDENEPPYFRKNHKELVLRVGQKISDVFWFKTNWHLIYLTSNGETHFIELDSTGGRNDLVI